MLMPPHKVLCPQTPYIQGYRETDLFANLAMLADKALQDIHHNPIPSAHLSQPGPEGSGRLDYFLDGELGLVRVGGLDIRGAGRKGTGDGEPDHELTDRGAGVEAFDVGRKRADERLRLTAVETF